MTLAGIQPATAPPDDPIREALENPEFSHALRNQALAKINRVFSNRPVTFRLEKLDDVFQKVTIRALQGSGSYNPDKGHVGAWLHTIVERVVFEEYGASSKQPLQLEPDIGSWEPVATTIVDPDNAEELAHLLAQLPADQRNIIILHHVEELSHEEIAARLNISVGNSRVRLARAIAALKRIAAKGGDR